MKLTEKQAQELLQTYKDLLLYVFVQEFEKKIESVEDYLEAREINLN